MKTAWRLLLLNSLFFLTFCEQELNDEPDVGNEQVLVMNGDEFIEAKAQQDFDFEMGSRFGLNSLVRYGGIRQWTYGNNTDNYFTENHEFYFEIFDPSTNNARLHLGELYVDEFMVTADHGFDEPNIFVLFDLWRFSNVSQGAHVANPPLLRTKYLNEEPFIIHNKITNDAEIGLINTELQFIKSPELSKMESDSYFDDFKGHVIPELRASEDLVLTFDDPLPANASLIAMYEASDYPYMWFDIVNGGVSEKSIYIIIEQDASKVTIPSEAFSRLLELNPQGGKQYTLQVFTLNVMDEAMHIPLPNHEDDLKVPAITYLIETVFVEMDQ